MKINVMGFTYKVVRGYIPIAGVGTVDHIKQVITIDPTLDYEHTVETLLHEVLHCVEFAMGAELKEPEVANLSRGLYSVLTDPQNEAFWAALAGSDEIMEEEEGYVALDFDEVLEGDLEWGDDTGPCHDSICPKQDHTEPEPEDEDDEPVCPYARDEPERYERKHKPSKYDGPEVHFRGGKAKIRTQPFAFTTTEDDLSGQNY